MKKWLENQRIEKKLTAGFLIIAILCVIVGVVGVINMLRMSKDQQDAYELQTMGIVYSANAEISFKETQTTLRDLYIDYGIGSEKGSIEQLNAQMAKVEEMMAGYAATITSDEGQQLYEETMTAYHNYADAVNEALKAVQEEKSQAQLKEAASPPPKPPPRSQRWLSGRWKTPRAEFRAAESRPPCPS